MWKSRYLHWQVCVPSRSRGLSRLQYSTLSAVAAEPGGQLRGSDGGSRRVPCMCRARWESSLFFRHEFVAIIHSCSSQSNMSIGIWFSDGLIIGCSVDALHICTCMKHRTETRRWHGPFVTITLIVWVCCSRAKSTRTWRILCVPWRVKYKLWPVQEMDISIWFLFSICP